MTALENKISLLYKWKKLKTSIKRVKNIKKRKNVFLSHVPRVPKPKYEVWSAAVHRQTWKWKQRTTFQGFRNFSFNLSSGIGPTQVLHIRNIKNQHERTNLPFQEIHLSQIVWIFSSLPHERTLVTYLCVSTSAGLSEHPRIHQWHVSSALCETS